MRLKQNGKRRGPEREKRLWEKLEVLRKNEKRGEPGEPPQKPQKTPRG